MFDCLRSPIQVTHAPDGFERCWQLEEKGGGHTDLHTYLEDSQVEISFWGTRKILTTSGETIYLHDVASHLMTKAREECLHDILSSYEENRKSNISPYVAYRIDGLVCAKEIQRLYEISDALIKKANAITRIFCLIQDFFFSQASHFKPLEQNPEDPIEGYLRGYCPHSFHALFHKKPSFCENQFLGTFGELNYMLDLASDEQIQTLLPHP